MDRQSKESHLPIGFARGCCLTRTGQAHSSRCCGRGLDRPDDLIAGPVVLATEKSHGHSSGCPAVIIGGTCECGGKEAQEAPSEN